MKAVTTLIPNPAQTYVRISQEDCIIGRNLKNKRIAKGWSGHQLAPRIDVSYQQLYKYELGTNRVSAVKLKKLSQIFRCSMADFFSNDDTIESVDLNSKACLEYARLFESLDQPNKELVLALLRALQPTKKESAA